MEEIHSHVWDLLQLGALLMIFFELRATREAVGEIDSAIMSSPDRKESRAHARELRE